MPKKRVSAWVALAIALWIVFLTACDYTGTGEDPMKSRYDDPPVVYTFLNSITGAETAVRIAFSPYTNTYSVTNPTWFTFLRKSAGVGAQPRAIPHGGGMDLPDPDEFQFDPWDIPLPEDDLPLPDIPLPDPFEDPWDDPLPLPPLPPDEIDGTDFSPGTLDITNDGLPVGYAVPGVRPAAAFAVRAVINVGSGAAGIVASPNGKTLYVAVSGGANIAVVDRKAATITSRINLPTGAQPYALAITPDGTRLYAGEFNLGGSTIYSIDLPSGTVKTLSLAGSVITQMLVTPDGTQLWICNYFGQAVYIVDVLTNTLASQIQVSYPWNVAFTSDGTRAYITNGNPGTQGAVNVYDTDSLKMVSSIPVGATPRIIRITPSGRHAFVTNYDSSFISQLDLTTNTLLRNIPIGGTGASGIKFAHQ